MLDRETKVRSSFARIHVFLCFTYVCIFGMLSKLRVTYIVEFQLEVTLSIWILLGIMWFGKLRASQDSKIVPFTLKGTLRFK